MGGSIVMLTWCSLGVEKKKNLMEKGGRIFTPICQKSVFPQTIAMPSTPLDRPLSEMAAVTPYSISLHNM